MGGDERGNYGEHDGESEDLSGGDGAAGAGECGVAAAKLGAPPEEARGGGRSGGDGGGSGLLEMCGEEGFLGAAGAGFGVGAKLGRGGVGPVAGGEGAADFVEMRAGGHGSFAPSFWRRCAIWRRARKRRRRMPGAARPVISAISRWE